jgi:hypothetical protein
VIDEPMPAPSIINPMMESPETVSSPRFTVIAALSLNFSTTPTNLAEARACRPFSLQIFITRVTAPDVPASPRLSEGGALISRQVRGLRW